MTGVRHALVASMAAMLVSCGLVVSFGDFDTSPRTADAAPLDASDADIVDTGATNVDATLSDAADAADGPRAPRRRITVRANTVGDLLVPGFVVTIHESTLLVSLETASPGGLADVHIENKDGVEIDRYIDSEPTQISFRLGQSLSAVTQDATFWLVVRSGAALADPKRVWAIFDEFDGTSLSSRWTATGTPIVQNGAVTLPPGASIRYDRMADGLGDIAAMDVLARTPSTDAIYWLGFRDGDLPPWWMFRADGPTVRPQVRTTSGLCPLVDAGSFCDGTSFAATATARWYAIHKGGGASSFSSADSFAVISAPGVELAVGAGTDVSSPSNLIVERIRAWAIGDVAGASVTVGPEE